MSRGRTFAPGAGRLRSAAIAAVLAFVALILASALDADRARADYTGITSWKVETSSTQAGGHPDVSMYTTFKNAVNAGFDPNCLCNDARVIRTEFPAGFIGNPHAVPKCTLAEFGTGTCPPEAQVGITAFLLGLQVPLYNMVPHPDEAGLIGFRIPAVDGAAFIELSARTDGDFGLIGESSPIFHLIPIESLDLHLWGVPADEKWDKNRWPNPQPPICNNGFQPYPAPCFGPVDSNVPPRPYLQNPTKCGDPLSAGLTIEYYNRDVHHAEAEWPAMTGCDQLTFNPSLSALPTTSEADSPSGLDVNLKVPQIQSPSTPTPSAIKAVTVTLPDGLTINPNAADGKTVCTDAQAAFGTRGPAQCPEPSKLGTARLDSSALPAPIDGAIYLGEPLPDDKYRIFLTASGFATHVKFAGTIKPDPQTGKMVVSFGRLGTPDLPQAPFSEFDMHFFGSERGLLATPEKCGTYPVRTEFVPWNDALPAQFSTSYFTVDSGPTGSGCPPEVQRPFSPSSRSGSADSSAGRFSSFSFKLTRDDGDQNVSSVNVKTPKGFAASLRGIPYCPEAAINTLGSVLHSGFAELAAPLCPVASQVGTASAATGSGSQPLHTPGKVFLAGPYKGAPLSLEIVIPAVSGPYDLGNVAVRAAVHVDRETAEITTVSDPIPQVLDGIPLRLRQILVNLDRPNFALNPTGCLPGRVDVTAFGDEGGVGNSGTHYQASNCSDLRFKPKLGLRLRGGTKRTGHPSLRANLRMGGGESAISRVAVTLPRSLQLDNANIKAPCTRAQFAADSCPQSSIQGRATAVTPILDEPLSGPVYLVSGNNKLPDLVASLKGQVAIDLRGRIDTVKSRLRTTFGAVPDVPVSRFTLDIAGGRQGILQNNTDICRADRRAKIAMRAQNNRRSNSTPRVAIKCGRGNR